MMKRLGRHIAMHPYWVIASWLVVVVGAAALALGAFGEGLFDRVKSEAPWIPNSESEIAINRIDAADDSPETIDLVVVGVDLADPAEVKGLMADFGDIRDQLEGLPGVAGVLDPFQSRQGLLDPAMAPLLSVDGDGFLVRAELSDSITGADQAAIEDRLREIPAELGIDGASGLVSSTALLTASVIDQVEQDLLRGEVYTLPLSFIVMVVVFGGFLAASMPLVGALAAIATGMAVIWGATFVIDIDSYIVNVLTIIGLALSIDYGLLVVSRYREELLKQVDRHRARKHGRGDGAVVAATEIALGTAGRTVLFSALTIAISIGGLILMNAPLLQGVGIAGVAIVLLAVLTAVTLVPAHLVLMGRRMAKPSFISRIPGVGGIIQVFGDVSTEDGLFAKLARGVAKAPWFIMTASLAILLAMAYPLLGLQPRSNPLDYIPADSDQSEFLAVADEKFPLLQIPDLYIVSAGTLAQTEKWAAELADNEIVDRVNPVTQLGDEDFLISIQLTLDNQAPAALDLVRELRAQDPGFENWVGGSGAQMIDFTDALIDGAPLAIAMVVAAVMILLFLMTGSIVVPIKALLVNALSLAASLGVTVLVFQDGYLANFLDFTSPGGMEVIVIALVLAFGFGLAMDYEVFLISRVKEYWDATGDNDLAMQKGLQKSGRIITSAALIMTLVFVGLIAAKMIVIKEVGFALALTVIVDASLVRMLLVPATMTVFGKWNWWAPKPLRRFHERFGISE